MGMLEFRSQVSLRTRWFNYHVSSSLTTHIVIF
jgi:hypothetical protein